MMFYSTSTVPVQYFFIFFPVIQSDSAIIKSPETQDSIVVYL